MPLELSYIFQALAHNHRRLILQELAKGPKTVGEIRPSHFPTPSALSKHVKILERAQLITRERRGTFHCLRLNPAALVEAEQWISSFKRVLHPRKRRTAKVLDSGEKEPPIET